MRNIKLTVSYDGAGYHGWQRQENALSVQEVLERAIARCTNEKVNLIGCGRTDTGVHAKAYICNFHTESKIPAERFVYAINAGLPWKTRRGALPVPALECLRTCARQIWSRLGRIDPSRRAPRGRLGPRAAVG